MCRVAIDNDEHRFFCTNHQALEEFSKYGCGDCSLVEHEPKLSLCADRRDHVERETATCCSKDWGLSLGGPSMTSVVIGTDTRLISKVDGGSCSLGFLANLWIDFMLPLLNQFFILLPGLIEGFLGTKPKQFHDPAQGVDREFGTELFFNQGTDNLQGPESKLKLKLLRGIVSDCFGNPLHLLYCQLGGSAWNRFGLQGILSARDVFGHPSIDSTAINSKGFGYFRGALSSSNCFDCLHSHCLKGLVIVLASVIISLAFHAGDCNIDMTLLS